MGEGPGPGREQVVSACQVRPFWLYSSHQGQASEGACGSGREEEEEGGSEQPWHSQPLAQTLAPWTPCVSPSFRVSEFLAEAGA